MPLTLDQKANTSIKIFGNPAPKGTAPIRKWLRKHFQKRSRVNILRQDHEIVNSQT